MSVPARQRPLSGERRGERRETRRIRAENPRDDRSADEEMREERRALSARAAAQAGIRQITELTGKPASGVTSLDRTDDGWTIGVEVVEDPRIPSSAEILGLYRVELQADGALIGYRRTKTYQRGHGDGGVV